MYFWFANLLVELFYVTVHDHFYASGIWVSFLIEFDYCTPKSQQDLMSSS